MPCFLLPKVGVTCYVLTHILETSLKVKKTCNTGILGTLQKAEHTVFCQNRNTTCPDYFDTLNNFLLKILLPQLRLGLREVLKRTSKNKQSVLYSSNIFNYIDSVREVYQYSTQDRNSLHGSPNSMPGTVSSTEINSKIMRKKAGMSKEKEVHTEISHKDLWT